MTSEIYSPPVAPPVYVDNTNQLVGIGTATPNALLHLLKSGAGQTMLRIERTGTSQWLDVLSGSGTPAKATFSANSTSDAIYIYLAASGGIEVGDTNIGGVIFDRNLNAVAIGTGTIAVASAKLEIGGTTKGFLPPSLTTTQKNAISAPATGLVVYDNTLNKLAVFTGTVWETVTSV